MAAVRKVSESTGSYVATSACKNPCLVQWDKSILFPVSMTEAQWQVIEAITLQMREGTSSTLNQVDLLTPDLAKAAYYESLVVLCSSPINRGQKLPLLDELARVGRLSSSDILQLLARYYLDSGLRALEDSLQGGPSTQKAAWQVQHPYQIALVDLKIQPETEIIRACQAFLESMESPRLALSISAEVRVATLAIVGHAVRADNAVDSQEKAFLQQITQELGLSEDDQKRYPYLMKSASVQELCTTIKKWALTQAQPGVMPAVASYVLRAFNADGVLEFREEKLKTQLFMQLGINDAQIARLLFRIQLDRILAESGQ